MRPGDRMPDCGNKLVPAACAGRLDRELLQWLPGETLFSLVSRLHRLGGHRLADQTADVLFGRRRMGYQHDFPSGLHEFERSTAGLLGDVRTIALERTLLRYYRPFLTPAKGDGALARMARALPRATRRLPLADAAHSVPDRGPIPRGPCLLAGLLDD